MYEVCQMDSLTTGVIESLFSRRFYGPNFLVRVLSKRFMANSDGQAKKARLNISDGSKDTNSVMCSGNLDSKVATLGEGSLIRVTRWSLNVNPQNQQAVLIIMDFEALQQASTRRPYDHHQLQQQQSHRQPNLASPSPSSQEQCRRQAQQLQQPSSQERRSWRQPPPRFQQHEQSSIPINVMNPYMSSWTITARISSKSELRHWSSASGEGVLFSVDLLDANGDEIRGVFFNEEADHFYPQLQKGKVYRISGGKLKESNRKYTSIPHRFSITFDKSTTFTEHHGEDAYAIKDQVYNFLRIGNLPNSLDDATIDVLCIVVSISDVAEIITSKNEPLQKLSLTVADDSLQKGFQHNAVDITIFGDRANQFRFDDMPVVAFKNLKKTSYSNCSLVFRYDTDVIFNPPEGKYLWTWKEIKLKTNGIIPINNATLSTASVTKFDDLFARRSIAEIEEDHLGQNDAQFYTIKAHISFIKKEPQLFYLSCPEKHKLIERAVGNLHCEKCCKDFATGTNRYLISLSLSDRGGSHWFTAFNEAGFEIFGISADQLSQMNSDESCKVINTMVFRQYLFKIKSCSHTYNDETSVKSMIIAVKNLDLINESKQMLQAIRRYDLRSFHAA